MYPISQMVNNAEAQALCMASWEGIPVDTIAKVDVNIVDYYNDEIIARDLRLLVRRQYIAGVTRTWTLYV